MTRRNTHAEPLSRSEIARTALAMVDAEGVDRFTMRRLAERLGVTPMAVYHHYADKASVLKASADEVWIEVATSFESHDDPIEEIVASLLTVRRTFMRHVQITPYAVATPTSDDALDVVADEVVLRFERAGVPSDRVADAYYVLTTYTLGSAALHAARTVLDRSLEAPAPGLAELVPFGGDGVAVDAADARRAVREAMDPDPGLTRFERGLREMIAGILRTPPG